MATIQRNSIRGLTALAVLLASTGCAGVGMGTLADILTSGVGLGGQDVSGEVRRIDERRQEIEVAGGWGRTERVRYDRRTQVVYRQRRYDVRSLERGDRVRMRIESDRRGTPYATYIEVQQSQQERRGDRVGRDSRLQRWSGTVARIDSRAGWFELRPNRGRSVLMILPYDPSRSARDRFRRLRRGQRVTVEGYLVDNSRAEIYRFR